MRRPETVDPSGDFPGHLGPACGVAMAAASVTNPEARRHFEKPGIAEISFFSKIRVTDDQKSK